MFNPNDLKNIYSHLIPNNCELLLESSDSFRVFRAFRPEVMSYPKLKTTKRRLFINVRPLGVNIEEDIRGLSLDVCAIHLGHFLIIKAMPLVFV